jgi:hypothetical protein
MYYQGGELRKKESKKERKKEKKNRKPLKSLFIKMN